MRPFAIAGMQLALSHRGNNLPRIHERLAFLMHVFPWIEMVVFSELAACGPAPVRAEPFPGPTEDGFCKLAADHRVWLVTGSQFEASGGKVYNTASVIDPTGAVVGRYRKMFPFLPYEIGVAPGEEYLVFDVPAVGRFGVSICYDMWFPETSRCLVAQGAEVIIHPAMTWTIDREVELAMARATAAQNQCFVVDVNGAGDLGNGRSVFVDPAGAVLYEAGRHEEMIPIEIDLERVHRSREVGLRGLGQPLKSFRDARVRFPVYEPGGRDGLASLGPLVRPSRTVRPGTTAPAGGPSSAPAQGG